MTMILDKDRPLRIGASAIGILAAGWFLFSLDEPPMFWQGLIYGLLFATGSAPLDNGPDTTPYLIRLTWAYGFQTLCLIVLLAAAVIWVVAAPADQLEQAE